MCPSPKTFLKEYALLANGYFQEIKKANNMEDWRTIRLLLSRKRKDAISLIERTHGVNVSDRVDYTGSPFINEEDILDAGIPDFIRDFLRGKHFLKRDGKIFSRGQSYYFLYEGITYEEGENPLINKKIKVKNFDANEFCKNIEGHVAGIFQTFEEIHQMKEGIVNPETILKIELILLDQLKNIILFSLNFCLLYFDPNFFGKSEDKDRLDSINILNSGELKFLETNNDLPLIQEEDKISIDREGNINYGRVIQTLLAILPYIEHNFAVSVINKPDNHLNPYQLVKDLSEISNFQPILVHVFSYLQDLFESIAQSSKGGKDFAKNLRNKTLRKLIRHNREEDNFLFMLQTALDQVHLIRSSSSQEVRQIDIICPLYGGAEMPFIFQAVGSMLMHDVRVNPRLIAYSYYDLKNANTGIDINRYPHLARTPEEINEVMHFTRRKIETILSGVLCLIMDDNVYTGRTLNDFYSRFKKEYPNILIATTATKIQNSKAINYPDTKSLLKKVLPTSGYAIPDKGGRNGIVYRIGKRLVADTAAQEI